MAARLTPRPQPMALTGSLIECFRLTKADPDFEWLMIDASYIKAHPHRASARGGTQAMDHTKRALNNQLHLAVDAHGMPMRLILNKGTLTDCTLALTLTADLQAQYLLADRGYETNAIVTGEMAQGMESVIPLRSQRKAHRFYDQNLHRLRYLVENAFLNFKHWRGVATRYAKRTVSYLAICQIRMLVLSTKSFLPHCLILQPHILCPGTSSKALGLVSAEQLQSRSPLNIVGICQTQGYPTLPATTFSCSARI